MNYQKSREQIEFWDFGISGLISEELYNPKINEIMGVI
jgi:hypothetical protein